MRTPDSPWRVSRQPLHWLTKKLSSQAVFLSQPPSCLLFRCFLSVPAFPSSPSSLPPSGRQTRWPSVAPAVHPDVESLRFSPYVAHCLTDKELPRDPEWELLSEMIKSLREHDCLDFRPCSINRSLCWLIEETGIHRAVVFRFIKYSSVCVCYWNTLYFVTDWDLWLKLYSYLSDWIWTHISTSSDFAFINLFDGDINKIRQDGNSKWKFLKRSTAERSDHSCCASLSLCWPDNLLIDYQFTFSLLQEDDRHYTAINFMATPEQVTLTRSRDEFKLVWETKETLMHAQLTEIIFQRSWIFLIEFYTIRLLVSEAPPAGWCRFKALKQPSFISGPCCKHEAVKYGRKLFPSWHQVSANFANRVLPAE